MRKTVLRNRKNGTVREGTGRWKVESGERIHRRARDHRRTQMTTAAWRLTKECRVERDDRFGYCKAREERTEERRERGERGKGGGEGGEVGETREVRREERRRGKRREKKRKKKKKEKQKRKESQEFLNRKLAPGRTWAF